MNFEKEEEQELGVEEGIVVLVTLEQDEDVVDDNESI